MVEHGLGVGFSWDFAFAESLSPNLKVLPITDDLEPVPIFLLRHGEYSLPNFANSLYEFMVAELRRLNGWTSDEDQVYGSCTCRTDRAFALFTAKMANTNRMFARF